VIRRKGKEKEKEVQSSRWSFKAYIWGNKVFFPEGFRRKYLAFTNMYREVVLSK